MESITNLIQAQLHSHIDTTMTLGEKATAFILLSSTFAGFLFLASKLFSFTRLIFSLFLLPGTPPNKFVPPTPKSPSRPLLSTSAPLMKKPLPRNYEPQSRISRI
ncbi:MAG: hypothetical protein Q9225_003687 [Loekoesia sp. 1 TL-2023]